MVLPQISVAYCRVPKAANSSVRYLLAKRFKLQPSDPDLRPNQDRYWLHLPPDQAVSLTGAEYAEAQRTARTWCFTVVRDPVARLYSAWNNKVIENKVALSRRFQEMGVLSGMAFEDFIDLVADSPDEDCDIHVRSQTAILCHEGHILPDYIARVETLPQDWRQIQYQIRVRCGHRIPPLPHRNARTEANPDIAKSLPRPVLDKIIARYRKDFEHFYPATLNQLLRNTATP